MASRTSLWLAERLWNWRPHSQGQLDWITCQAKVRTAAAGRRWGKSEAMGVDIVLYALENPNTTQFVIAPTDDQTKIIMGQVSRLIHAIPGMPDCIHEVKSPYHSISFLDGGGLQEPTQIKARTAGPDGKGIRGNRAHRVILDEAAYVADDITDNVIGPLLADYDGDLVKISTPAGMNHFHRDFVRGQDLSQDRYRSFQFPSSANPYLPSSFLESEKANKPERTWQQEYLAQFLEDAGGVFRGVQACVDDGRRESSPRAAGRTYSLGADVARAQDFTVLSVVDDLGVQVYFERFNQISWERITERIVHVAKLYDAKVWIDSTGVGDPIFEALRKQSIRVEGYQFTNASKERLIDNLAMLIERTGIRLMDEPVQTGELQAYAYEITAARNIRMNAPEGGHDDTVCALALSAWPLRERRKIIAEFY